MLCKSFAAKMLQQHSADVTDSEADFNFNARQHFFDFQNGEEDEGIDSFFDNHEGAPPSTECSPAEVVEQRGEHRSPEKIFCQTATSSEPPTAKIFLSMGRKSMSTHNLLQTTPGNSTEVDHLSNDIGRLEVQDPLAQPKCTNSTQSLSKLGPRRWASRENLARLAKPKSGSVSNLHQNGEYVSLAKAVADFHSRTPVRFRSHRAVSPVVKHPPLKTTIPVTPKFSTIHSRPKPLYVTKDERDLQEIQSFKLKALPLNKRILSAPVVPIVEKKAPTVMKPFQLTEVKKVAPAPAETHTFHAKPVPPSVYNPFRPVPDGKTTDPQTPLCMKRAPKVPPRMSPDVSRRAPPSPRTKLTSTKVVPFSFEERDKHLMQKKEELIKKTREEQRRAREFHAQPLPAFVHGKAFEVKKSDRGGVVIEEFNMYSDQRAKEREEFEKKIKEKDELLEKLKEQDRLRLLEIETNERLKLRKAAEVKAHPVRKFKEVKIMPSNKITIPISPQFETNKIRNKENISQNSNV